MTPLFLRIRSLSFGAIRNPPSFWRRFVDDALTTMKSSQIDNFLQHLNSLDQNIQFTKEEARADGSMLFLDVLIIPREDGSVETTVYRKPTHTDLYLQWDSSHTLTSKYGVVGTLLHRAQQICSSPELLQQENKHLHQALKNCKFPEWALNKAKLSSKDKKKRTMGTNTSNNNQSPKPYMVVPYHKGVSESLKKTCNKHGLQVYFKGGRTIKSLLMAPKDKDPILKKSGVIYRFKCGRVDCDEEYIGESSRTFAERFKEHQKMFQSLTTVTSVVTKSILTTSTSYFVGVCRDYFNSFTGQLCPYKSRQVEGHSCCPSSSYY